MKICRFENVQGRARVGLLLADSNVLDLSAEGIDRLSSLLEFDGLMLQLTALAGQNLPRFNLGEVRLLAPVEQQEVWAAGVTYLRSKKARMDESEFSASAYDRVYDAPRLEIFFKSMPEKVGYTAGNNMSSRDIEGENLLYLPQAKVYHRSCALGPFITLGVSEAEVRGW